MKKMTIDDLGKSIADLTEIIQESFRKEREHNDAQFAEIRSVQDEHSEILDEHGDRLTGIEDRLVGVENKLDVTITLVDRHDHRLDLGEKSLKKLSHHR